MDEHVTVEGNMGCRVPYYNNYFHPLRQLARSGVRLTPHLELLGCSRLLHRSIQAFDRSITHLAVTGTKPDFF